MKIQIILNLINFLFCLFLKRSVCEDIKINKNIIEEEWKKQKQNQNQIKEESESEGEGEGEDYYLYYYEYETEYESQTESDSQVSEVSDNNSNSNSHSNSNSNTKMKSKYINEKEVIEGLEMIFDLFEINPFSSELLQTEVKKVSNCTTRIETVSHIQKVILSNIFIYLFLLT